VPAGTTTDWLNTTYTVTCDGIVPGGLPADVVDGTARVDADGSRPPYFEHYDIAVAATASGDVDGDGASDAVVLLECSPQPSNGIVQEVQVFSSTGDPLGTLPSPRTLAGEAPLPPEYPAGLSVQHSEIVAENDCVRAGRLSCRRPSVPLTLRRRLDGQEFVKVLS
jgi:hypothetical protein